MPNTKELPGALACHQLVKKVTPPNWKETLDNMSMEDLCDLHGKSYTRQVVLDNHMNDRTRDLVRTLQRAREKMDAILAKEKKKDQEFADLRAKCEEALQVMEKNLVVLDLRKDIRSLEKKFKDAQSECKKLRAEEAKVGEYKEEIVALESKCEKLESERVELQGKEIKLREELDGLALKKDRAAVVSKVVPYIAMELYHSDEVGRMIAGLINTAMYHGKCITLEEIAATGKPVDLSKVPYYRSTHEREYDEASNAVVTAEYPFLREATKDNMASVDTLLSMKPRRVKPPSSSRRDTPKKASSPKVTPEKALSPEATPEKLPSPIDKDSYVQPSEAELEMPQSETSPKGPAPIQQESPHSAGK